MTGHEFVLKVYFRRVRAIAKRIGELAKGLDEETEHSLGRLSDELEQLTQVVSQDAGK